MVRVVAGGRWSPPIRTAQQSEPQQTWVGDRRYHTTEATVCGDELVHEPA
jgi:hypothetical protein